MIIISGKTDTKSLIFKRKTRKNLFLFFADRKICLKYLINAFTQHTRRNNNLANADDVDKRKYHDKW